jgi:serine protease Do
VLPNGPAKKAGLAIGDVILRYNGTTPTDDRALLRSIAHTPIGDTMELTVRRGGAEDKLLVTATQWPRNQWDALDAPVAVMLPKISIPHDLGLALSMLPAEDSSKLQTQTGLSGVLVTNVAANSDPARKGLAKGDIILRVQDKPVATPDDVQSGIDGVRARKRDYVLMLVLPKTYTVPGPKWVTLQVGSAGG